MDTCAKGGNFIHYKTARRICEAENLKLKTLRKAIQIEGFNGQKAPAITHKLSVSLQIGKHHQPECNFLVTDLGKNDMIIGNKWMTDHGAIPVPTLQDVWFIGGHCRHEGAPPPLAPPRKLSILPRPQHHVKETDDSDSWDKPSDLQSNNEQEKQEKQPPRIEIAAVSAQAFFKLAQRPEAIVMAVSMRDIMDQHEKDKVRNDDPLEFIPKEYRDFADVFSTTEADTLAPHRGSVDHHIVLKTGMKPNWAPKLYKMSQEELNEVRRWVTDNLSKGFIEASQAPWASPIMFTKKPGGGIRLCHDFRKLNAISKKDGYPLPLIDNIMTMLSKARIMTRLDIRHAFNRIRFATKEDEDLTTFATPMGNYKSLVLPFGLTGGPATFQRFINNILMEYLNDFCSAYMDDVIIFSETPQEHTEHVRKVLTKLREAALQADIKKSEFNVEKTKFLGLLVSKDGLEMDPEKVKTILDWEQPRNLTEVQGFVGFCNFYRRFIRGFSKLVKPLTELSRKDSKNRFHWTKDCQEAFETMKKQITSVPILRHFDHSKISYVEVDSSDYVHGGCLSQKDDAGLLHPVAFFSRKLTPAECNYEIYDKELLAIISAFEHWRPELEGTEHPIQVLTDHKALEYFMTTKKLTRRQARWALTLANYNFEITYRPGKQNMKADSLTRRPGDRPEGDNDDRQELQFQTVLTPERLSPDLRQQLIRETENQNEEEFPPAPIIVLGTDDDPEKDEETELPTALELRVKNAQQTDELCQHVLQKLRKGEKRDKEIQLGSCKEIEGSLYYRNRIWVPQAMQTEVLDAVHRTPLTGHPGTAKMLFFLQKTYYWPRMDQAVKQYLRNCHECRRTKPFNDTYNGLLNPLSVPDPPIPWRHISMDFITQLPPTKQGHNTIAVQVCRLTKRRIFTALRAGNDGLSAKETAKLVFRTAQRLGAGMIDSFVSDRGSQWDCEFWDHLCRLWGIRQQMSTAFHPQTDGQTEVMNRELERYLRHYTNYLQDDWDEWLFLAESAQNSAPSATTKISPFLATNGYEPRMPFASTRRAIPNPSNPSQAAERQRAEDFASKLHKLHDMLQEQLYLSQTQMEEQANKHRTPAPDYKVEDLVWLNGRNIKTQRPCRKLDDKNIGPCRVIEKISPTSYKLQLPEGLEKVHPVFHSSLLRWYSNDPLPGQHNDPPPPIHLDSDEEEWEVEKILDSRIHYGRLQYKAQWKGYPPSRQWWNADGFQNAKTLTEEFHTTYPEKPRQEMLTITKSRLQNRQDKENEAVAEALQRRRQESTESIQQRQRQAGEQPCQYPRRDNLSSI